MFPIKVLLIALLLSGAAYALPSDREKPIELSADSVDVDESTGISVYQGDVDLRQGTIRLLADKVTVHQKGSKPQKVIAEGGPVRFEQESEKGPVRASAHRAEYEVDSENLVLIGDAVLSQGKDSMRSDRIVYDRVKSLVKAGAAAKGSQRVKITIQPK